jgi:hypothetical protein
MDFNIFDFGKKALLVLSGAFYFVLIVTEFFI